MKKVLRDGAVAVLYSPGFGAGWSTWNEDQNIMFDSRIVEKVEQGKQAEITTEFMESIGYTECFCGGVDALEVKWVSEGDQFEIREYDGFESVHVVGEGSYCTA